MGEHAQEHVHVPAERRRAFDRLVNFTDAVVAIALTLQLLPLIEIEGPAPGETVWHVIADNWGQIFAFLLSFVIVVVMWTVHNRVFNVMRMYDGTILWLNIGWMLAIAFLPWPTAMYGTAGNSTDIGAGGVGLLYWLNLALISGLGSLIGYHAARHPELLEPGAARRGWLAHSKKARLRGIVIKTLDPPLEPRTIMLATRKGATRAPAAETFIRIAKRACRARLARSRV